MSFVQYLHTKAKAFVVFLFAVISIGVFIISTLISTAILKEWYGLIPGLILMILAIPFHWMGKKRKGGYLISFLLNSVANGCSVAAYYVSKNIALHIHSLFLGVLPALGVLLLAYFMLQTFHKTKRVTVTVACIINGVLTIALLVLWIIYGSTHFSFGFFASLISFFYLCVFGITINHDERSVLRDISFGSFGSFIIITIVVIFLLTDGEILDGADFDFDIGGNGKKRKKQKRSN